MQFQRIDDEKHPLLDPYRELRTTNTPRWSQGFIAEGKLVVERLLESSLEITSVLISDKRLDGFRNRIKRQVPVLVVPHELASTLVGFDFHAGVMACGRRPEQFFASSAAKRLDRWASNERCTLIVCPNTTLPDNLGSIIRLAAAFEVNGLLVTPQSADPYSRRCVRVSMGNIYQLPTAETADLLDDLACLKARGFEILSCHQHEASIPVRQLHWPAKVVLVFGNEATGIPFEVQKFSDNHIEVPMSSKVDSLNVSTAAAIILNERYHWLESSS